MKRGRFSVGEATCKEKRALSGSMRHILHWKLVGQKRVAPRMTIRVGNQPEKTPFCEFTKQRKSKTYREIARDCKALLAVYSAMWEDICKIARAAVSEAIRAPGECARVPVSTTLGIAK